MSGIRKHFDVHIRSYDSVPGFDRSILQMRAVEMPEREFDRVMSMELNSAGQDPVGTAFLHFGLGLLGKTNMSGGEYCDECINGGNCAMETQMRVQGHPKPFCAVGRWRGLAGCVSLKKGDAVQCVSCGEEFVLTPGETMLFNSEIEWLRCPHCGSERDIADYLNAKQEGKRK